MKRLALLTCAEERELWDDDVLLLQDLRASGIRADPVVWNDPVLYFTKYDFLLLRSVWDYHLIPREFLAWLNVVEKSGVPMYNTPATARTNMNKTYLRELAARGAPLIPSFFFFPGDPCDIVECRATLRADTLIIKPMVGASAHGIIRLDRGSTFNANEYCRQYPFGFIVQRYVPEVEQFGEVSLVFFEGEYSHAVRKVPTSGDFRVQDDYGGTFTYINPRPEVIAGATTLIRTLPELPLYGRVDCLELPDTWYLMEIELIEPILFLHRSDFRNRFMDLLTKRM